MQAPTHILTGILLLDVYIWLFPFSPLWAKIVSVFFLCIVSHFLLDVLSIFTYHPPKANWKDWFWVSYHLLIYTASIILLVFFIVDYWWVILAANLPDILDWFILRLFFKTKPFAHPFADKIRSFFFKHTPNWNHKRWTIVIEIALIGFLLTLVLLF